MFSSQLQPNNEKYGNTTARLVFGFFNCKDLSNIRSVCKTWNNFITKTIFNEDIAHQADKYKDDFKLYTSNDGFILEINIESYLDKTTINSYSIKPELIKIFPFLKPCYEVLKSPTHMYFWSTNGFDFYLMQDSKPHSKYYSDTKKMIYFQSNPGNEIGCRIEFTNQKAIIINLEQEELMSFNRSSQKEVQLLLKFIIARRTNMIAYENFLQRDHLLESDNGDLIFIGRMNYDDIVKIKTNDEWNDVQVEYYSHFGISRGYSIINHPEFECIILPEFGPREAILDKCDGSSITFKKLDPHKSINLNKFPFYNEKAREIRLTPLDLIEWERKRHPMFRK